LKWFGSSGVRGVSFEDFSIELSMRIGYATGSRYRDIVIGRDGRITGQIFLSAISSAIMSMGANACDVGILPTPSLAYATRDRDCGVMITASHNPPEYNGVKLWNPDGSSFDTRQMEDIESLMMSEHELADWSSVGSLKTDSNAIHDHSEGILARVGESKIKVVVDCANGPASLITPYVLENMGCRVTTLNAQIDGSFPGRPAEPAEENLSALRNAVLHAHADLGIAHDGDADRMVAIDDKGRYAGGDVLLKVFAKQVGAKSIVAPIDATMVLEDWFSDRLYRTRVGDAFVSEKVKERNADFGGEPSGTWIFPEMSLCPDGIFAAAKLVEICAKKRLSELVDSVPSLPMIKETISFKSSIRDEIISNLNEKIASVESTEVDRTDGYRLRFEDGWALIRLSGTEPKIRIAVEARTMQRAKEIMERMMKVARSCLK